LVVIFASLLFQQGMQFWFSDKANTVLSSAENVSQIYEKEHRTRIALDVQVMGGDVVDRINEFGILSENFRDAFLYQTAARQLTEFQMARGAATAYQSTLENSRKLQFRFNAVLLLGSLLIVAISIWIALTLADRLVRPVGQLVEAARKVGAGDLSARVPSSPVRDEVATLGSAFNRMTRRLEEQTGALV